MINMGYDAEISYVRCVHLLMFAMGLERPAQICMAASPACGVYPAPSCVSGQDTRAGVEEKKRKLLPRRFQWHQSGSKAPSTNIQAPGKLQEPKLQNARTP